MELQKSWKEKTEVMSTILRMLVIQPTTCKDTLIIWKFLSDYKSSIQKVFKDVFNILTVSSHVIITCLILSQS